MRCYRSYPLLFAALALGVIAPYGVIVRIAERSTLLSLRHGSAGTQLTLTLVDLLLVGPLISALHIHAVVAIGDGRTPALVAVARSGLRVLPVVTAAAIMSGLGIAIGLVLLFVPGVILALRWAVVAQAAAVEPVNWSDALRRSHELTRGNYGHVLGLVIVMTIAGFAITSGTGAAIGNGAGPGEVLVGIVVETIARSFTALTAALLYFDLLARSSPPSPAPAD